jgi:hypothetical protein
MDTIRRNRSRSLRCHLCPLLFEDVKRVESEVNQYNAILLTVRPDLASVLSNAGSGEFRPRMGVTLRRAGEKVKSLTNRVSLITQATVYRAGQRRQETRFTAIQCGTRVPELDKEVRSGKREVLVSSAISIARD